MSNATDHDIGEAWWRGLNVLPDSYEIQPGDMIPRFVLLAATVDTLRVTVRAESGELNNACLALSAITGTWFRLVAFLGAR